MPHNCGQLYVSNWGEARLMTLIGGWAPGSQGKRPRQQREGGKRADTARQRPRHQRTQKQKEFCSCVHPSPLPCSFTLIPRKTTDRYTSRTRDRRTNSVSQNEESLARYGKSSSCLRTALRLRQGVCGPLSLISCSRDRS